MNRKQEIIIWITGVIVAYLFWDGFGWWATDMAAQIEASGFKYHIVMILKIAIPAVILGGLLVMSLRTRNQNEKP